MTTQLLRNIACISTAAIALAGCFGGDDKDADAPRLDMDKIENFLAQDASARLDSTFDVNCPARVTRKKGGEFTCVATTINAIAIPMDAKQRDAKGNVTWHMDARTTDEIEEQIADGVLEQTKKKISVVCPDVIPYDKGGTFTCVAGAANGKLTQVVVTQTDDKGSVTWSA